LYDGHTRKFQFKAEEIFLSESNWRLKLTASRTSFDILKMNSGNLLTKGSFCYYETKHLVLTFLVNLEGFKEYKLALKNASKHTFIKAVLQHWLLFNHKGKKYNLNVRFPARH